MSVAEELDKLEKLHNDGTITDEQYERARARVLQRQEEEAAAPAQPEERPEPDTREARHNKKRKALHRFRDEDEEDDEDYSSRRHQQQAREWSMFLHLSLFAGHAVPLGGIIAPIIIWQTQKETLPEIDQHGKNAVNWILSNLVYALICLPLCFVGVGFVLLLVLGALNVVFPVIAAMKAHEGRVWSYPLAIPFVD